LDTTKTALLATEKAKKDGKRTTQEFDDQFKSHKKDFQQIICKKDQDIEDYKETIDSISAALAKKNTRPDAPSIELPRPSSDVVIAKTPIQQSPMPTVARIGGFTSQHVSPSSKSRRREPGEEIQATEGMNHKRPKTV
jgi:hypothetical protein